MAGIRVVFQGGGARLSALLAAADAIQEFSANRQIPINRVAGTSAGAIAACLLATKIPISKFREQIRVIGKNYIEKIFPKRSVFWCVINVFRGKPIGNRALFREFIKKIFEVTDPEIISIDKLPIGVFIIATDILNKRRVVYKSDGGSNNIITDCLVDSAALPFIFHSPGKFSSIIDGGICDNLPISDFINEEHSDRVIAISFEDSGARKEPDHALEYAKAIVDSSISHSVERSCKALGDQFVYRIKTTIGTFDFERALTDGLSSEKGSEYNRIKSEVFEWLDRLHRLGHFSSSTKQIDLTSFEAKFYSRILGKIYENHYRNSDIKFHKSAMIVTANCLIDDYANPHFGRPDDVRQRVDFSLGKDHIHCLRLGISTTGETSISGGPWITATDSSGNILDIIVAPTYIEQSDHFAQLIYFDKPLHPNGNNNTYRIERRQYIHNTINGLAADSDRISVSGDYDSYDVVDIIIYVPSKYEKVVLESYKPNDAKSLEGRRMNVTEMSEYDIAPPGFCKIGWRGEGFRGGSKFGVVLKKT